MQTTHVTKKRGIRQQYSDRSTAWVVLKLNTNDVANGKCTESELPAIILFARIQNADTVSARRRDLKNQLKILHRKYKKLKFHAPAAADNNKEAEGF